MSKDPNSTRFDWTDVEDWVGKGLLQQSQAEAIRAYTAGEAVPPAQPGRRSERRAGLNVITVAYYFGAFSILFAYTLFMGLQWESLGRPGQVAASLFSMLALWAIGGFLVKRGFPLAGSLLIFAGTGVVPLFVYTLERISGIWPSTPLGSYADFYPLVAPAWVYMELVAIFVALGVLYLLRFPLLVLLIGFWTWFLSMDLTRLISHSTSWTWSDKEQIISVVIGLAMLAVGVGLQGRSKKDYSFWLYIFGHCVIISHLGALTLQKGGPLGLLFLATYLLFVVASVWLQSRVFLVFGAIGCYGYASYLAFQIFKGSLAFVFSLASLGLVIILTTVAYQRFARPWLQQRLGQYRPAPV